MTAHCSTCLCLCGINLTLLLQSAINQSSLLSTESHSAPHHHSLLSFTLVCLHAEGYASTLVMLCFLSMRFMMPAMTLFGPIS